MPESANNATIFPGSGSITDASGNIWTIVTTSNGQVALNGTTDTSTSSVIEGAYVNHAFWQENSANLWWKWDTSLTPPSWQPPAGTSTSPLPNTAPTGGVPIVQARVQNPRQVITDVSSISWGISCMCQVMFGTPTTLINGTATIDLNTSSVSKVAIVGANIWHVNSAGNWFSKAITASPVQGGWAAGANPLPSGLADRVLDFVNTFAFNTLTQGWTAPDAATHVACANYMGFRRFRAQMSTGGGTSAQVTALVNAGLKATFIERFHDAGTTTQVGDVAAQLTDTGLASLVCFEGSNEPQAVLSAAQVQALATALGSAVDGNSATKNVVPVASYSSLYPADSSRAYENAVGDLTARLVHWATRHGYTNNIGNSCCSQPWASPNGPQDAVITRNTLTPGRPLVITELGTGVPNDTRAGNFERVTSVSGGKMMLNYLIDGYFVGSALTAFFEMFDITGEGFAAFGQAADSNTTTVTVNGVNIFPYNVATVFHNFTTILNDPGGADAATFTPTALNVTVTNLPTTGTNAGRFLILQISNGTFAVIITNEPEVQTNTPSDLFPTPTAVTLTFGQAIASAFRFDPTVGTASVQTYGSAASGGSISVPVAGSPQIVMVTPVVAAGTGNATLNGSWLPVTGTPPINYDLQYGQVSAIFTGSISGSTLTVSSVSSGALAIGQTVIGIGVSETTTITAGSGTSWTLNHAQTIASQSMGTITAPWIDDTPTVTQTTQAISGLLSATTYAVRLKAANTAGTSFSPFVLSTTH